MWANRCRVKVCGGKAADAQYQHSGAQDLLAFLLSLSLRTLINWGRTWPYGIPTCFIFLCMSFHEIVKYTLVASDLSFLL